jgi:hypothetical protein
MKTGDLSKGRSQASIPLLKSFDFIYKTRDSTFPTDWNGTFDHHMAEIRIEPMVNGEFPIRKSLRLGFADKGYDDPYDYDVQHYLLYDPSIRLFDTGINKGVGHATKSISRPTPAFKYEFVLRGFQLQFRDGLEIKDHHINEVGIIENNGKVTVDFNDKDYKDPFLYRIWYAYVPKDEFSRLGESNGIRAQRIDRQGTPPGPAVIRGFRLNFEWYVGQDPQGDPWPRGWDHHIRQIQVDAGDSPDDGLQVAYADQNGDDGFEWRVKWGILNGPFPDQPVHPPR